MALLYRLSRQMEVAQFTRGQAAGDRLTTRTPPTIFAENNTATNTSHRGPPHRRNVHAHRHKPRRAAVLVSRLLQRAVATGLSGETDPHHRAVRGGRPDRYALALGRPAVERGVRPAGYRREPQRSGWHHRH